MARDDHTTIYRISVEHEHRQALAEHFMGKDGDDDDVFDEHGDGSPLRTSGLTVWSTINRFRIAIGRTVTTIPACSASPVPARES